MTVLIGIICLALLALLAYRERRHEEIVRELMQRIQAPALAIAENSKRSKRPPPLPFDDTDERAKVVRLQRGEEVTSGDPDSDS